MTDTTPEQLLNAALAKAQGEFPVIPKDKTGGGGSFAFKYATLDTILSKCRKPLAGNGLSVVQMLEMVEGRPSLRTELRHAAGGVVGASFPFQVPDKEQELGKRITYLRRYALSAILGIAAEEDTDGNQDTASTIRLPPTEKRAGDRPDPLLSTKQRSRLFALFTECGFHDREQRLAFSRTMIGRQINSSTELTAKEANKLITVLEAKRPEDAEPEIPFGELPEDY